MASGAAGPCALSIKMSVPALSLQGNSGHSLSFLKNISLALPVLVVAHWFFTYSLRDLVP